MQIKKKVYKPAFIRASPTFDLLHFPLAETENNNSHTYIEHLVCVARLNDDISIYDRSLTFFDRFSGSIYVGMPWCWAAIFT